jgi:hypothetical protein
MTFRSPRPRRWKLSGRWHRPYHGRPNLSVRNSMKRCVFAGRRRVSVMASTGIGALPPWQHATQSSSGKMLGDDFCRQHGDSQVERRQAPDHADIVELKSTADRDIGRFLPMVQRPRLALRAKKQTFMLAKSAGSARVARGLTRTFTAFSPQW